LPRHMDILPLRPEEVDEAVVQEENWIIRRIKTRHVAIGSVPTIAQIAHSTNSAMKTVVDLSLNEIGHVLIPVNALVTVLLSQSSYDLRISESWETSKDILIALRKMQSLPSPRLWEGILSMHALSPQS